MYNVIDVISLVWPAMTLVRNVGAVMVNLLWQREHLLCNILHPFMQHVSKFRHKKTLVKGNFPHSFCDPTMRNTLYVSFQQWSSYLLYRKLFWYPTPLFHAQKLQETWALSMTGHLSYSSLKALRSFGKVGVLRPLILMPHQGFH